MFASGAPHAGTAGEQIVVLTTSEERPSRG
jgi:hypothetical protein